MKLRTWKYYISQGFRGVFKNGLMSAASIIIVSACVFTVILSLSIMVNVDYVLNQIESNVGVTVFLGNKPTDAQVKVLQKKIEEMPNVTKVTYISQQGALEKAKKMWDTDTLDGLKEDNPFPRSLDVQVSGISHQKDVIARITKLQQEFENQIVNGEVETVAETTTIDPAQAAKAAVNNAVKEAGSQPTTTKTALLDKLTGTVEVQAEGTSATPVTEGLPTLTKQPLLAAIFGGIVLGLGLGIVFYGNSSTGGTGIITQILNKYTPLPLGMVLLIVDGIIVAISAIAFPPDTVMYSILSLYIVSFTIDKMMVGLNSSRNLLIISQKSDQILNYITRVADRGATKIPVLGGHTGHAQNMIMTTLSTHEVPKVQEEIQKIDETAFIVIVPASTVMGRGFSLQKDYKSVPNDFINPL